MKENKEKEKVLINILKFFNISKFININNKIISVDYFDILISHEKYWL